MKLYMVKFFYIFLFAWLNLSCNANKKEMPVVFNGDVFDDAHLHELKLYFASENYWDSLVWNKKLKDSLEVSKYLKCNLIIDGTQINDIGVRFKGESSYDFTKGKKKSFKLDLNRFVRKQKYCGVSRFNLNNNYKDPSFMREKLSLDMMSEQGLPSPKSAFAKVYLNDEYWGVYLLVENIDKTFLKRNFKNNSGNFYIGEPNGTLDKLNTTENYYRSYRKKNNKKRNDWTDLIQFIDLVNSKKSEVVQTAELDSMFATDACLKTWAINNLMVNVDAYNMMYPHNYFLYHDSLTKRIHWINYDYNYSFAAWNPKFIYEDVINFPIYFCNEKHPFAKLILENNISLKKRYTDHLTNLVNSCLNEEKINAAIKKYQSLINEAVLADNKKEYSNEEFEQNLDKTIGDKNDPGAFIPGLREFVHDRKIAIAKQLEKETLLN